MIKFENAALINGDGETVIAGISGHWIGDDKGWFLLPRRSKSVTEVQPWTEYTLEMERRKSRIKTAEVKQTLMGTNNFLEVEFRTVKH